MPLGRLVTTGFNVEGGISICSVIFLAHTGSLTPVAFDAANDSLPPKLFEEIGLPEGCGVKMAEMAWSKSKYCLATRLTSATVTWRMAAMSSSGDCRPSMATASDHAEASPDTEFF